jgi:hypothetical protein
MKVDKRHRDFVPPMPLGFLLGQLRRLTNLRMAAPNSPEIFTTLIVHP